MYVLQDNGIIYTGIYSYQASVGMSVISFTLLAGVVLFNVCYPFDKYRAVVFSASFASVILLLFISGTLTYNIADYVPLFRIDFKSLTVANYMTILVVIVPVSAIYFFMIYLITSIFKFNFWLW